jgi:hypothetical protein
MRILSTPGPVNGAVPILSKGEAAIRTQGTPNLAAGPDPGAYNCPDAESQGKSQERAVKDCKAEGDAEGSANEAADPQRLVHVALPKRQPS